MKIDTENIVKYWKVITIISSLVVSLMYFVIENKIANRTILELSKSNKILSEKISKLEGHKEGVDNVVRMFMENPPGQLDYRLKQLEYKVFGNTNNQNIVEPPKPPINY
jgi:hypothetical protein